MTHQSRTLIMVAAITPLMLLVACEADYHADKVQSGLDGDRLDLGTVQREIRTGMSGGEVLEVLGSPNVVSTDEEGREVWVYDRFASDVVRSEGGWFVSAGAASRSQRTLTVIVKFDHSDRVRDFAYHASRF